MATNPVTFPLGAGPRFDASSIELVINGQRYIGCSEVEYSQELMPGTVRGLTPQAIGFTRGVYSAKGSLTMYREEFQALTQQIAALAQGGFLEAMFLIDITYSELLLPLNFSHDSIWGVRFTEDLHKIQAGSGEALTVQVPFVALYVLVNGIIPFTALAQIATAVASAV